MKEEIHEQVRQFLLSNYLEKKIAEPLTGATKLRTSGLLDSLAVLGLVTFVEDTYDLEFAPHELGIEAFDSIDELANLVSQKKSS
jgi:acyl carrier protein